MVLPLGDIEKTRIVPVATYALMALNIALFFVEQDLGETFQTTYAATPYEITHDEDIDRAVPSSTSSRSRSRGSGRSGPTSVIDQGPFPLPGQMWLTILTAMFLHASPLHLAGNMLFLWIFGDNVEEVLGTFRYVLVYLALRDHRVAGPDRWRPRTR